MSAVTAFTFEGSHEVRTMTRRGEPWFVLNDVCGALGIGNSRMAADRLDDDEKDGVSQTDAIGRQQTTTIVNEPGLYRIIMRSDKPQARRFQKWVFTDVLPAIRKTGRYEVAPKPVKVRAHRRALPARPEPTGQALTERDLYGLLMNAQMRVERGEASNTADALYFVLEDRINREAGMRTSGKLLLSLPKDQMPAR